MSELEPKIRRLNLSKKVKNIKVHLIFSQKDLNFVYKT